MTRLDQIIDAIKEKHVYIQTHDFPDPDAIASAYGMQVLLESRGIHSTICYKGRIDRYSTSKMVQFLGIQMEKLEDMEENHLLSESDEVILVDSQKGNSNIVDMTGDEIICIDHHPETDHNYEYRYKDIRSDFGACATMIAEYFLENDVEMNEKVATAFTYAIRIDTAGLMRGICKKDIEVLSILYDKTDYDIIRRLENSVLYREDLKVYSKAIDSIEIYDNVSFAYVGSECPETLIAQICDFTLELVEVEFSVVYSLKKDGVKISIRSERKELDAGKIVQRALKGIGNGGGHASMAGGFVPLKEMGEWEAVEEIKDRFISELHLSVKNEDFIK